MQPWRLDDLQNVGHVVTETAARMPDAIAVAEAKKKRGPDGGIAYDEITFASLEHRTNAIASQLIRDGVACGDRIALMVPPGIDFVACVFALFKSGANVILIDPGMGRKNMIRCLAEAKPVGMVGIPLAHVARNIYRRKLSQCRKNFVVGWFPFVKRIEAVGAGRLEADRWDRLEAGKGDRLEAYPTGAFAPVPMARNDSAAIIFTTGSTGPPKGVLYRHRVFIEQAQQIRDYFSIEPGTVDVSGFPLFALFNTAMGTTTVFPDMDATRPASVHPPNLIDAVNRYQADQSFGSPALWNTVSRYCIDHQIKLPTVKRVLSAGAPVPAHVLQNIRSIIADDGDAFTPYGATEALPIACNSATVVLEETGAKTDAGQGTCVGTPFATMDTRVIQINDDPIASIDQVIPCGTGEIGELIVRGVTVTDQYVTSTDANAMQKIVDGDTFWHRMGDLVYCDDQGRIWFCGRKSHRVITSQTTMFTVPCEAIINTHPLVYRSALVGVGEAGSQTPVMIAELWPPAVGERSPDAATVLDELRSLADSHDQTNSIDHFFLHPSLPVDIRHNSKIFREQLRPWAAEKLVSVEQRPSA